MERKGQPERVIPIRVSRTVKCNNCENDNLIHGGFLAKASMQMMVGGPGQLPQFIDEKWALYYCLACDNYFPYPKQYTSPGHQPIKRMYQQILSWFVAKAQERDQQKEHMEKLVSIIQANKDLLGLPNINKEDSIEASLKPLMDRIDELEYEIRAKKGGRPKHCRVKLCKTKAGINGLCKAHEMETI